MIKNFARIALAAAALLLSFGLGACAPARTSAPQLAAPAFDCEGYLRILVQRERAGTSSKTTNDEFAYFADRCSYELEIFTTYSSASGFIQSDGEQFCPSIEDYDFPPEVLRLIKEDGGCASFADTTSVPQPWPEGGLGWDEATSHVGDYERVCGPIMSIRGTEDGVFVNVGQDYPSSERFTFVIWGDWWLDRIPDDAVLCATGEIYLYDGVGQIELGDPGEIEIWR